MNQIHFYICFEKVIKTKRKRSGLFCIVFDSLKKINKRSLSRLQFCAWKGLKMLGDIDSPTVRARNGSEDQDSDEGIDVEVISNDGRKVSLDITSVDHLAILVCKKSFFYQIRTTLNTTVSTDLNQGLESADGLSVASVLIKNDICNESRGLFLA